MPTMLQVIGAWPAGPGSSSWPTWAGEAVGAGAGGADARAAACLRSGRATLSAFVPKGQVLWLYSMWPSSYWQRKAWAWTAGTAAASRAASERRAIKMAIRLARREAIMPATRPCLVTGRSALLHDDVVRVDADVQAGPDGDVGHGRVFGFV